MPGPEAFQRLAFARGLKVLSETEKLILIYRAKARNCAALSETARPENRPVYRQLARTWERIATQVEDLRAVDITLAKSAAPFREPEPPPS